MPYKIALPSVLLLSLALIAGCAGSPKHPTWNNATGSEQSERLIWQAIKGRQWKDVESHLAPMFVGVGADGKKYDRAGWMAYWKSGRLGDYSLGDVTVDPAGADMVVSYVLNIGDSAGGAAQGATGSNAANRPLRVVSVWQPMKRGWIMTATSFTPVRE